VSTPNLSIPHILQSQAQKEVTGNEAFDRLDEALNDFTAIDVSAGNTTVSAGDFRRNLLLMLTGAPAAPLNLTVPASKRLFIVENASSQDVTVMDGVVLLTENTIARLEGRIQELRESPTLGFTTFIDTAQINAVQKKIDELSRARGQTQARIAFLEGPPEQPGSRAALPAAPDDTAGVKERAERLQRIQQDLESTLFGITYQGSELIIQFAEAEQLSPSEWRLSMLLRARRGTEWAMNTHQVGETVLVLDPATLTRVSSLDEVSLARLYRAVSIGSDANASAVIGPIPGTVIRRRIVMLPLATLCRPASRLAICSTIVSRTLSSAATRASSSGCASRSSAIRFAKPLRPVLPSRRPKILSRPRTWFSKSQRLRTSRARTRRAART
jgi:hypothetical protein